MKKLSPEAILDFMKVYYEITGKVIPYEQAEDEANRLIRLLTLFLTSDKIRTMEIQIAQARTDAKESKMRKPQL